MKQLMIETVKRSTPEEVAQLLCDMAAEKFPRNQMYAALNALECVRNEEDRLEIMGLMESIGVIGPEQNARMEARTNDDD
jgi:hypothetical protein